VKKQIGWVTCTCIVVANMIGTGVFTSLGFQVAALPSGFAILAVWALGALFALCGALVYAELSGALPRSGGEYNFLSRIYHPGVGFMAGLVSVTVGFAAPVALAAMAFGEYFHNLLPAVSPLLASVGIVSVATLAHGITIGSSMVFQNLFTSLKLTLILFLILSGWLFGPSEPVRFLPQVGDASLIASTPFAIALMYVMYSYSGWNASTYIMGEVRRPERNVPISLILAAVLVGVLYLALNATFLKTVPMSVLAGQMDVGALSASAIFGAEGGRIMSGLIAGGLISCISAMTWAGPRVMQTIGEDFPILKPLSWRTRAGIPLRAIGLQFGLVMILILTATFEAVLLYTQFALVSCSLITVIGLVVLRIREPNLPRPFRCWGYPVTPMLFALTAVFSLGYTAWNRPIQAIAGVLTLVGALALYFAGRRLFGNRWSDPTSVEMIDSK
jgi:APA family basic amino acid/polyamine antiporter